MNQHTKNKLAASEALPPVSTVECMGGSPPPPTSTTTSSPNPSGEPPYARPKPFCKNILCGAAVPTTLEKARSTGEGEWAEFPYIKVNRRILYDVAAARKILASKPRIVSTKDAPPTRGGSPTKPRKGGSPIKGRP